MSNTISYTWDFIQIGNCFDKIGFLWNPIYMLKNLTLRMKIYWFHWSGTHTKAYFLKNCQTRHSPFRNKLLKDNGVVCGSNATLAYNPYVCPNQESNLDLRVLKSMLNHGAMPAGPDVTLFKNIQLSPGAAHPLLSYSAPDTLEINLVTNNRKGTKGKPRTPPQEPNEQETTTHTHPSNLPSHWREALFSFPMTIFRSSAPRPASTGISGVASRWENPS